MSNNSELPTSFSGTDSPIQTSGKVQCGAWPQDVGNYYNQELLDGTPSECRVYIIGTGVQRISNSLQQCELSVSISAGTVQLNASVSDALNGQQQVPTGSVIWKSDNSMIASVSNGLVTLHTKGQAVIRARYSRSVIPSMPNNTPSSTEAQCIYAECLITIGV